MPAPIAVFAFNRPEHLHRTLSALAANDLAAESSMSIFCDGPRDEAEKARTDTVREIAQAATGFKSLTLIAQEANQGLAPSIISGVTRMVEQYGAVIVVEDDLVTSPHFLRYMNDGLELYADNPQVASIHGWCFPHAVENAPQTFFLRGADCLGWATWQRAWKLFDPDADRLLAALRRQKLVYAFNCNGSYDYMAMLRACHDRPASSWAVRWRATAFVHDMYTLHPGRSLVQHIGGDGQGTNAGTTDLFDVVLSDGPIPVAPQTPQEHAAMRRADMEFHSRFHAAPSRWRMLKQDIRARLPFLPSRQQCKKLLKDWLPPVLLRGIQKLRRRKENSQAVVSWQGDYPDWQSAAKASGGYDQDAIFVKVREAARAVRDGRALWERDSVLFYHEEFNFPLVALLMKAAARNKGCLSVLDFGGALGSTYMQHRRLLRGLDSVSWNVVEQPHVAACGRSEFSGTELSFWPSMAACCAEQKIDVVLFSNVLQYLENPYAVLDEAIRMRPKAILIDRIMLSEAGERITVQHTPDTIYAASYPCRLFTRRSIEKCFENSAANSPLWFPADKFPPEFWSAYFSFE